MLPIRLYTIQLAIVQATVKYFLHQLLKVAINFNQLLFKFYLPRQQISRGLAQVVSIEYVVYAHIGQQLKLVEVSSYFNNRIEAVYLLVKLLARIASSKFFQRNIYFVFYCKIKLSTSLVSLPSLLLLYLSNTLLGYFSSKLYYIIARFSIALSFLAQYLLAYSS